MAKYQKTPSFASRKNKNIFEVVQPSDVENIIFICCSIAVVYNFLNFASTIRKPHDIIYHPQKNNEVTGKRHVGNFQQHWTHGHRFSRTEYLGKWRSKAVEEMTRTNIEYFTISWEHNDPHITVTVRIDRTRQFWKRPSHSDWYWSIRISLSQQFYWPSGKDGETSTR